MMTQTTPPPLGGPVFLGVDPAQKREFDLRQQVLSNPERDEALFALVEDYERRGDYWRAALAIEETLRTLGTLSIATRCKRLGRIYDERLSERQLALEAYGRASNDSDAVTEELRLLVELQHFDAAAARLSQWNTPPKEVLQLVLKALVERPAWHAAVLAFLPKVQIVDAGLAAALAAEIDSQQRDLEARIKKLREEAISTRDKARAAHNYLVIAQLTSVYGKDQVRAREHVDKCLLLVPGFPPAVSWLTRELRQAQQWTELAAKLNDLAQKVRIKDRRFAAELSLEAARVFREKLSDTASAVEAEQRALDLDPGSYLLLRTVAQEWVKEKRLAEYGKALERFVAERKDPALEIWVRRELFKLYDKTQQSKADEHLERLVELDPLDSELARHQETTYRARGNWVGLTRLLAKGSAHKEGAERAALLEEQSDLFTQQGRREEAYQAQAEALRAWPTGVRARKLLGLAGEADFARARSAIEDATKVAPSDYRAELELVLSELAPAAAVASVATSAPTASTAPATLSVAELRAQAAQVGSSSERLAILSKGWAGHASASAADQLALCQEIVAIDPHHGKALEWLAQYFRKEEKWAELGTVLERLSLDAARKSERIELAKLYEQRLGRAPDAARTYINILQLGESAADVLAALERLLAAGIEVGVVGEALAVEYAQADKPARAKELLQQVLAQAHELDHKIALLDRLAELEAKLNQPAQAIERRLEAWSLQPARLELGERVVRDALASKNYPRVREVLKHMLAALPPPTVKRRLAEWAGQLSEAAGDTQQAAADYFAAYEADPSINSDKLESLLVATSRLDELDQFYTIASERADGDLCVQVLRKQLALRQKRNDSRAAQETLQRLAALRPDDQQIVAEMDSALSASGDHSAVAARLEARLAALGADAAAGELLVQLAKLYAGPLAKPQLANEKWIATLATAQRAEGLTALQAQPLTATLARALLEPYRAAGDAARELQCLQLLVAEEKSPAWLSRIYELVAQREPGSENAFNAGAVWFEASAGLGNDGNGAPLEAELVGLAQKLGRTEQLVAVLRRTQNLASRERGGQLSLRIASIVGMDETNPEQAIEAWRQAVAADPHNLEALSSLDRLLRNAGRYPDLIEVLRLRQNVEVSRRLDLQLELAALYAGPMADQVQAIAEFEQATRLQPDDARGWNGLGSVYLERKEFAAAITSFMKELELVTDPAVRKQKLLGLAQIYQDSVNDPNSAATFLAEVLRLDPTEADATQRLETILAVVAEDRQAAVAEVLEQAHTAQGDLAKLFNVRDVRIARAADPMIKRELILDAARLYEIRANDPIGALRMMAAAFRLDPRDERVRAELERLGTKAQNLGGVANEYEAALPVITDAVMAVAIRRRLAELYEKHLNRPSDAVAHLQAAAELAGGDAASLDQVARLLRTQDKPAELAEIIGKQLGLLGDNDRDARIKLSVELADLRLNKLNDKHGAVNAYQQVVALDPKNVPGLTALDRLLTELDRKTELVEVLTLRREIAGASDLGVELNVRLGDLHREQPLQALTFYKAALQRRPQNAPALAALEALLDMPDVQLEVAAILEPLFTAKQDYARLAKVLEVRLERASVLTEKKGLIRRIGDIYENRLSQKDKAFFMALRALREDPADMGIRMWLEKLAQETTAFDQLASAYIEQAHKAEAALALQFHRRAAGLLFEKVQNAPGAIEQFREVLSRDPKDLQAHVALEKLYGQTGQLREQAEILVKLVDLSPGTEKKLELLGQAAEIQEKQEDYDSALATRRRQLQLAPEDMASFDGIGSIYLKLGRPEDWAKALDTESQRIADRRGPEARARRMDLLFRRALVTQQQLGDSAAAANIFDQILKEEPNHQATIQHLEERVREGDAAFAAVALERVYEQSQDWSKFVDVLEAQLTSTPDHTSRKQLLLKIAHTQESKLDKADMAFITLSRAFTEDSGDTAVRQALERLSDAHNNHAELAELYGSEIETMADPHMRLELTQRTADIHWRKLNNAEDGVTWYRKVLALDANSVAALSALDDLYTGTEKWSALTEILDQQATLADTPEKKTEYLWRLGLTWGDKMFEPDAAIRALSQARGIAPQDLRVLQALERYFAEVKAYDEMASVLRTMDEVPSLDQAERIRVRATLGNTLSEHLRDPANAIDVWKGVLALDPSNEEATATIEQLYRQLERYEELAVHLKFAIEHAKTDTDRTESNRRLAEVMADHLGNTDEAVSSWSQVLKAEPRRLDALRALIALHGKRDEWAEQAEMAKRLIPLVQPSEGKVMRFVRMEALGKIESARAEAALIGREILSAAPHTPEELSRLADLFEAIESFEDAAKAVDRSVELQPSPELRLKALRRSADIYLDRLNRPTAAVPSYEKILEIHPTDKGAFDQVRKILRNAHEWRRLVATNEGFVSQYQGDGREDLLTEIRDIHDKELGQKDLAFIAACRVFKEFPVDSAADVMERLAGETEGWEELSAVYEDSLEELEEARVKINVLRRLAKLFATQLSEPGAAEEVYERLLVLAPGDAEALDRIAEIRSKQGRFEDQVHALEDKLGHAPDLDSKKNVLRQIAHVWETIAKDTEKAIAIHKRVLDLDPSDKFAIDSLSAIYEREDRHDALISILQRSIDLAPDPRGTIALREKMASMYEGKLNDPESAISAHRQILELEPTYVASLQALERLYTGLNRWRELIEVFEKWITLATDDDTKVKLFAKAGAVFEEHFEDRENALICYDNILSLDPNHLATLRNEERLLKETKQWDKLIQVLGHHAQLIAEPREIVKLYIQIGDIYYRHLTRVDKAEEIYNAARSIDPNAGDALAALGKLYERSGNWFQSLEMLQREADALKNDPKAVDVYFRMGKINENMLMDTAAAKGCYQRAMQINPRYVPALAALKDIAFNDKDWDRYVQYMVDEAEATEDSDLKTELLFEAGKFFQETRNDPDRAERFYNQALEVTGDYLDAARPLAELYFRKEDWVNAERVLEIVVAKLDPQKDLKELGQKMYRLGYLADKQSKNEQALVRYEKAFEIDSTYLPTLEGLGHAYIRVERWDDALKAFNAILVHHRDALTNAEVVDLFAQMGDLLEHTNQLDKARRQYEKALEVEPQHSSSLRQLANILEKTGDFENAYDFRNKYVDVAPREERVGVLLSLAQLSREHLKDPYRSIDALLEAQKLDAKNVDVLEALVQLYTDTKQAAKVADLTEQLWELVPDASRRIAFGLRLGDLFKGELKNLDKALKYFNAVLDIDPAQGVAFGAIEQLLADAQEWRGLEENYRAMLARLPVTARAAKASLFRTMADLYSQVLKEPDSAIVAYEAVVKLEPGKQEDMLKLASLYGEKPELRAKAITMQQDLAKVAQNPAPALRELRKLYQADKKFDRVYWVCHALVFLKQANDEDKKIYEYLKKGLPPKAQRPLTEQLIRDHLLHPGAKTAIGELCAQLYRNAPDQLTKSTKDLNLKKKELLDIRTSQLFFANVFKYVAGVLAAPAIDVYQRQSSMAELELVNSRPPALLAGEDSPYFKDIPQRLLSFHLARNVTYARPDLFLARAYPGDALRDLMAAFVGLFNQKAAALGDPREVQAWMQVLSALPEPVMRRVKDFTVAAYGEMKNQGAVSAFSEAAEYSALRAGLLMCGDLDVAARGAQEAGDGCARLSAQQRVRELVLFGVSEDHFVLREQLGLAIKG